MAQHAPDPTPAPPTVVSFEDVSLTYPDGTRCIEGISFRLDEGDRLGVVGPSGCGKSTLLRLAVGLLQPSAGTVTVDPEYAQRVGMVFQDPTLLPWRSVRGNVELLAELNGVERPRRRADGQRAIELVGLQGFERHRPRKLSGGMKMRVSLARTIAIDPALVLFDEPFGALDEITRGRMGEELLEIARAKQFTSILITHSVPEAVLLSNRVVVMAPRPSRVVAEHTVSLPRRTPDVRFDTEFIKTVAAISNDLERCMTNG